MKSKLKLLHESFEELAQRVEKEIQNMQGSTASKYIPKLCEAVKRENPEMSIAGIRSTVINRMDGIIPEKTVRNYFPRELMNPKHIEEAQQKAKIRREKGLPEMGRFIHEEQREEEETPVSSQSAWDYEDTHPKIEESPFQAIGEINRSIARLWTGLTGEKNMAHMEDDIKKDHIIPTRERFKDIVNGSSKEERDFLYNWLTWLSEIIDDRLQVIKKADRTAYDR